MAVVSSLDLTSNMLTYFTLTTFLYINRNHCSSFNASVLKSIFRYIYKCTNIMYKMHVLTFFMTQYTCWYSFKFSHWSLYWQSMFDATLKDRKNSFHAAPGTSMFIHWLVGMVYVFYFASFILLLREVLRPGVLWFLRNLNDPEFNPIQEVGCSQVK